MQQPTKGKVLAIVCDSVILDVISSAATLHQWQLDVAVNAWDALEKLHSGSTVDLLVVDLPPGEIHSLQIVRWLRKVRTEVPIILIDRVDDSSSRQEASQVSLGDYVESSPAASQLKSAIRHNLSHIRDAMYVDISSDGLEFLGDGGFFIGLSPCMQMLRGQVDLLAAVDSPVLICGESGSGRETVARLLHRLSVRSGFEFASIDCALLPENLLEMEIFGCGMPDGSGSAPGKRGKLELCSRGTLFLDHISDMSPRLQSRISEVLESGRFTRLETSQLVDVEARIVAAISVPIENALSEQQLGAQLYRQLCSYELKVPPLRERREELNLLSQHFMHQQTRRYALPVRYFSTGMMNTWRRYDWPGNLRELEQAVKRYLIAGEEQIGINRSPAKCVNDGSLNGCKNRSTIRPAKMATLELQIGIGGHKSLRSLLQSVREDTERNAIALALEKTGWNRKAAARLLKISYRSILYKIDQYHMNSVSRPTIQEAAFRTAERLESTKNLDSEALDRDLAGVASQSV